MKYQKSFVSLEEAVEIIAVIKGVRNPEEELLTAFREGTLTARGSSVWDLPPSPAPYPPGYKNKGTSLGEIPIPWWRSGEVDWKSSAVSEKPLKDIKQWRLSPSGEGRVGVGSRQYTGLYANEVEVSRNELFRLWPELGENEVNPSEKANVSRGGGRRPGDGAIDDQAQLEKMQELILSGSANSPNAAAKIVAKEAKGEATYASKVDRLRRKYRHWSKK